MALIKNDRAWFGHMGLSTNTLANSFESFLLLAIFFFKLILVKLLFRVLPKKVRAVLKTKKRAGLVVLMEVAPFIPIFALSAGSCVLSLSSVSYNERFNSMGQVLLLFVCLAVVACTFIQNSPRGRLSEEERRSQRA